MRIACFLMLLVSFAACSQKKSPVDSDIFLQGNELQELTNSKLEEASDLAASVNNPGLLWTLNDSGNGPNVFLIDQHLNIKLTCTLKGIKNRDWEDLAVGPGPDPKKNYIYVGEIGDNLAIFSYKNVFRFEEPKLSGNKTELTIDKFDTITFKLPDGKKDCESLMIDPTTKDIYVVSKREDPAYLYKLSYPYSTKDTLTANKVMPIPYTMMVAADFSRNGKEILMKNYKNVYYWKVKDGDVAKSLRERPYIVQYNEEPQGESIAFALDGSGFYTISEKVMGKKSFLTFYPRKKK